MGWSSGELLPRRSGGWEKPAAPAEAGGGKERDGFTKRAKHQALPKTAGHTLGGEDPGFVCLGLNRVLHVR